MSATLLSPTPSEVQDLEGAFARYHAAWEANDPDRIADLHSADSWFWMHDGSPRVEGREAIRRHYIGLFERYQSIEWEPASRTFFGGQRWVFDYVMLIGVKTGDGKIVKARLEMVDVVDVNDAFEVVRKDVFVDPAAVKAALALAAG